MFANKNKLFARLILGFLSINLLLATSLGAVAVAQSSNNVEPDAGGDFLTFLGCDDDDKNGLDFADCLSSGDGGTVTSFTDFRGDLTAPNPEGYAAGLTQATDARTFILNVVNFALGFLGLIAVLVVIYGGVLMVTSAGGDAVGKGKKAITYAAIGLLVVMSSFAVVNTILLAPSGSEQGSTSSSAINSASIRGVAGRQRFNYLAQQIDQIMLRVYNSYQFHLRVKQEIDNAIANISAFDTNACYTPMSDCANQLQSLISSQLTTLTNEINNANANAVFTTSMAAYVNTATTNSVSSTNAALIEIDSEDCNSDNAFAEINPCSEQDIVDIRAMFKATIDKAVADLKAADFLQKSFEEDMNWAVAKTAEVFQSVSGLASESIGGQFFKILIPTFASNPTGTLPTTVAAESGGEYAKLNTTMKNQLKVGSSLVALDQTSIKNTLKSLVEIKSILENLKFVDTVISADVSQGNAPLIVNFSSVGSTDSSGFTITDDRIEWDINGDGKFSQFTNGTDEGKGLLNCPEVKKAVASCIFTKAGTYRITLRIKPIANEKNPATGLNWNQEIAPGISYIDILVNPPATKINLSVKPMQGGEPQPVIEYDDKTGTIKKDVNRVYFTLNQAKAGLVFDATQSKFSDGQTPLTNDPSSKIRWNFGVASPNNDSYMVPSDKSLSIEQAYPALGNYQVRFEVTDKNNVVDRKIFTVVVSNVAPRITNPPTSGKVGEELTFDGSESTSDAGVIIFNWKIEKLDTTTTAFLNPIKGWLGNTAHAAATVYSNIPASIASKGVSSLPSKVIQPTKRTENNEFYNCNLPEGKDDTLKCTFKKSGDYRVTLSLDDDGTPREESTVVQISSNAPTAGFKVTKLTDNAPALYKLDGTSLSFDPDETDNSRTEYSWEINPGNCVLVGFANVTPLENLIRASTDAFSSQTPCESLKNFNSNIGQPVVKFTQKGDYSVSLMTRTFDEPNLNSDPIEQTIIVDNVLDVSWGEMKPSAILKVPGDTGAGSDQLPENVNTQPAAEVKFIFISSQAISYDLDFGDGTNATGEMSRGVPTEVTHNYTATGKYTANLSVFDADDIENKLSRKIFIGDSDSPIAIITTKVNGSEVQPQDIDLENGASLENVIVVNRRDNVTFDAEQSLNTDGTGRRLKYSWNINNNEKQSTARQVAHNFSQLSTNGEPYIVKLKVSNEKDATQTGEDSLNVLVVGSQPTLRSLTAVGIDEDLITPVNVKLTAIGAEDEDGQVVQYKWWYYDANKPASPDERLGLQITTVPTATLSIGTRGLEGEKPTYKFGVEMTDSDNLTVSTDSQNDDTRLNVPAPQLQVTNGPNKAPVARFTVDRTSINVGEAVNFTSSSTDPDPGGGIKEYKWDFGDGSKGENKASVSHVYQKANIDGYKAKLTVVDNNSSEATSDTIRIFVEAMAEPPVAGFTFEQTPGSKTVKFTNTSTADQAAGASIKKYSWDFDMSTDSNGDGKKDNDIDSGEANPTYTYPNFGTYRAKLTVEDDQGQSRSIPNFVIVKPAAAPKTAGLIGGSSDADIDIGSSTPASKTLGANFFEASSKVDLGLLLASVTAYVILMAITRRKKTVINKNK